MKRIAIVQSSYVPWKGYFDLIAAVDEFILLDDVQFAKGDWRNRNLIKGPNGLTWLTVPVRTKGRFGQTIAETEITDRIWAHKHWKTIAQNYARAPFFKTIAEDLEPLFEAGARYDRVSSVNFYFLNYCLRCLGIDTPIRWSSDYPAVSDDREMRIIDLCHAAGATHYLSGPAARDYITQGRFASEGLILEYANYGHYPEYEQPYPPFTHRVSILDLLLSTGKAAPNYMYFGMGKKLGVVAETPELCRTVEK